MWDVIGGRHALPPNYRLAVVSIIFNNINTTKMSLPDSTPGVEWFTLASHLAYGDADPRVIAYLTTRRLM